MMRTPALLDGLLPIDPLVVAVVILIAGIVASFVPLVPGGLLSMLGVGYYWQATGEPGTVALVVLLSIGSLTIVFDWLGSALGAHLGGASNKATIAAAVAAVVFLFALGPLGALAAVAGTVFVFEYRRHGDARRGAKTAAYATVGMLASTAMQVLLTSIVLLGFLLAVL